MKTNHVKVTLVSNGRMSLDTTILQSRTTISLIKYIERLVKMSSLTPKLKEDLEFVRAKYKEAIDRMSREIK